MYKCEKCNYFTKNNSNYHKHLKTRKHIINPNKNTPQRIKTPLFNSGKIKGHKNELKTFQHATLCNTNKNDVDGNVEENIYVCKFCEKEFTKHQSYYRHMKYYCKHTSNSGSDYKYFMDTIINIKDDNKKEMKELYTDMLNQQNQNMKDTVSLIINEKDKNTEMLMKSLKDNTNNVNNIFTQNNTTMNNTNYVLNYINYSQADSMNNIKDKFKLTRDEFIKASKTTGYRGALMEKAENIIIKPYLKSQEQRPMHTVDISRKKALYKDNQNENWTFNPKITLDQCFNVFHLSALGHQDQTINENPDLILLSNNDSLYKQTYFIPTDVKNKDHIHRDVKNHIYKNTKVTKIEQVTFSNNPELELIYDKGNILDDLDNSFFIE
jgi:hypothetical protein